MKQMTWPVTILKACIIKQHGGSTRYRFFFAVTSHLSQTAWRATKHIQDLKFLMRKRVDNEIETYRQDLASIDHIYNNLRQLMRARGQQILAVACLNYRNGRFTKSAHLNFKQITPCHPYKLCNSASQGLSVRSCSYMR